MWNKLFKNKSKSNSNKSKLSIVVKSFSIKKNSKDNDSHNNSSTNANDLVEQVATLGAADIPDDEPVVITTDLESCTICGRKFNPQTLIKHERICEKMAVKKRKPFDSFRQRREGTDLADFLPKNFGLPAHKHILSPTDKHAPVSVVAPTPAVVKQEPHHEPLARRMSEPIKPLSIARNQPIIQRPKRIQPPVSERCPYCERNFGLKAYDRHVEWCREKTKIAQIAQNTTTAVSVAKERLQARTKYKAPSIRSKREQNREKYSGMSCGESTNSLSDIGSYGRQSEERERKHSISASMTSSFTSDGGLSDKYDPFLSAKRQLDELYLPNKNSIMTSTPTNHTKTNSMSTSLNLKSPTNFVPSQKQQISPITNVAAAPKSNFRRSSSLRISKKSTTTKPFVHTPIYKSPSTTIHRGISDEGPISTNFMKPEEYDELPVKSHAIITPELVPKSSPRDKSASPSRHTSPLHQRQYSSFNAKRDRSMESPRRPQIEPKLSPPPQTPAPTPVPKTVTPTPESKPPPLSSPPPLSTPAPTSTPIKLSTPTQISTTCPSQPVVVKRDPSVANRRNLRLEIEKPNAPAGSDSTFSLAKTDSLAAFLKYENELSCTPSLTEKEKKDKSNSLNKRSFSKNTFADLLEGKLDKIQPPLSPEPLFFTPRKYNSIKLAPLKSLNGTFNINSMISTPHSEYDSSYIDPKLINVCDNLTIDSGTTATSTGNVKQIVAAPTNDFLSPATKSAQPKESITIPERLFDSIDIDSNRLGSRSQRSSVERKQHSQHKDLLYDSCLPDINDSRSSSITGCGGDSKNPMTHDKIDSLLDDFDEIISSFEDDEQYPIFREYKDLVYNRSSKTNRETSDSSGTSVEEKRNHPSQYKKTEFSSTSLVKEQQKELTPPPAEQYANIFANRAEHKSSSKKDNYTQVTHREYSDGMSQAEADFMNSVRELDQMCASETSIYPIDSDELSSGENSYGFRRTLGSKFSADSAYGSSLSRQSQSEKPHRRTTTTTRQPRQPIPDIICNKQKQSNALVKTTPSDKQQQQPKTQMGSPNSTTSSSSGSESSLPPIMSQKLELHTYRLEQRQPQSIHQITLKDQPRLSRFCHSCGNRFVMTEARFCMECGTRRIAL